MTYKRRMCSCILSSCPLLRPVKEDAGLLVAAALSSSERRVASGAGNFELASWSSGLGAWTAWEEASSMPESGVPTPIATEHKIKCTCFDKFRQSWFFVIFEMVAKKAKSALLQIISLERFINAAYFLVLSFFIAFCNLWNCVVFCLFKVWKINWK